MIVREILDDIEQVLQFKGVASPGRPILTQWLSQELNELTGVADWDWAQVWLDPAVTTVDGTNEYSLPANFPENFLRGAGADGDSYCCKVSTSTKEEILDYRSPVQFHSLVFVGASEGQPTDYTVLTTSSGDRKIKLFPTPDAAYNVSGLYVPTDWALTEQDAVPPVPGNCAVLKAGVMRRIDGGMEPRYQQAKAELMLRAAQNRRAQVVPVLQDWRVR